MPTGPRLTEAFDLLDTPLGELVVRVRADGAVTGIAFAAGPDDVARLTAGLRQDRARCTAAVRELAEYFAGERRAFDLPLAPQGTPFELAVWRELERVPYGTTTTYGELARRLGRPSASRAVGRANGSNRVAIVLPCHRIIGANGALTGYAYGLEAKRALLALEAKTLARTELRGLSGAAPADLREAAGFAGGAHRLRPSPRACPTEPSQLR